MRLVDKRRIAIPFNLLFLANVPISTEGFFSPLANPNGRLQQRRAFVPIPMAVTIFPSFDSSASDDKTTSMNCSINNEDNTVDAALFQSPIWTAPLARLAAALGHVQNGASIAQVRVVSCDARHLDMEAVVCEQEQCVSLHIPVDFVHPCNSQELDDQEYQACLLDNLEQLNNQQSPPVPMEQMGQQDHFQLPDWWVYSESVAMAKECDQLCELLNRDEFQIDLVHLWDRNHPKQPEEQQLDDDHHHSQSIWNTVRVARIGLAGIVLQAAASSGSHVITTASEIAPTPYLVLPFQVLAPVSNANDLREAVLNLMEQE
jgi:hypothetical protein